MLDHIVIYTPIVSIELDPQCLRQRKVPDLSQQMQALLGLLHSCAAVFVPYYMTLIFFIYLENILTLTLIHTALRSATGSVTESLLNLVLTHFPLH